MTSRLNPYINFRGDARAAMEFYRSVFGGDLRISTFGEFGSPEPDTADQVMHAMLETDAGFTLMASDTPAHMDVTVGDNMGVSVSGDDADLLRGYWAKLSKGGEISVPMEKQMWGDEFGMCKDRFGVPWMVNITQPS
jgi:PhnB protein